jgi:hypothetical protein
VVRNGQRPAPPDTVLLFARVSWELRGDFPRSCRVFGSAVSLELPQAASAVEEATTAHSANRSEGDEDEQLDAGGKQDDHLLP